MNWPKASYIEVDDDDTYVRKRLVQVGVYFLVTYYVFQVTVIYKRT